MLKNYSRISRISNRVFQFSSNTNNSIKPLLLSIFQEKQDLSKLIKLLKPEAKLCLTGFGVILASSGIIMFFKSINTLHTSKWANYKRAEQQEIHKMTKLNRKMKKQNRIIHHFQQNGQLYALYLGIKYLTLLYRSILGFTRRYLNQNLTNRIAIRLRNSLFQNFLSKRATYFQEKNILSSDLVHKLSNDVTLVANGVSLELLFGVRGLLFVLGGSAYIIYDAQPLILPALITMFLFTFQTKAVGNYQRMYKVLETQSLAKTSDFAQEKLPALKLIKISDMEAKEKERYLAQLCRFYENAKKYSLYQALNFGIFEGFGFLSLIGILTYGSYLITIGAAEPGLVSSSIYAIYVAIGFRSLINTYTELIKTAGIYQGLLDIYPEIEKDAIYNDQNLFSNYKQIIENDEAQNERLRNPQEQPEEEDLLVMYDQDQVAPPKVEFVNITFNHQGHQNVLQSFNMSVESGQVVALIGQSGSGKTTILNLLTRVIIPSDGDILIDGESLRNKDYAWIQRYISYVPQDATIFSGSVYENIIYGNQGFDQSLERVIWASKMARAHDFIMNMKDGYKTILKSDGGVSLSGGQKQRIVLARAILKNPKILILDEATSNIDSHAEYQIIQALRDICKGRTCFIVTHKIENYKELITRQIDLKPKN